MTEIEEADNTLRDLHNSSYDTKVEFNNCNERFNLRTAVTSAEARLDLKQGAFGLAELQHFSMSE